MHARNLSLALVLALAVGCTGVVGGIPDPVVSPTPTPTVPPEVVGHFDGIDAEGLAAGWAYAPVLGSASIEVALYADGDAAGGTLLAALLADQVRDDVNADRGLTGRHGFNVQLPLSLNDGQSHAVRAFGLGSSGPVELGHSPITFQKAPRCATAGPRVDPSKDEYVVALKADNGKFVSADCGGDDVGLLTADRDAPGGWETFYLLPLPNGAVTLRTSHGRYVSAEGAGGAGLSGNRPAGGPWEQFAVAGGLSDGSVISLKVADGVHFVSARVDQAPPRLTAEATAAGPWERFTVQVSYSPVKLRRGVVRGDGRSFVDDDGAFYPLGGTLFWSLWGWKNDPARLKQNLDFLKQHRFDYVRILGEVDWPGKEIDPNWADYSQVLGEFIDCAYDVYGLRTELTLVGGKGDPMVLAQKAAAVINAGRQHKILDVEVANESYGRPLTLAQMTDAGRWLRQNIPNLVALSSGEGLNSYAPNSTDWLADYRRIYMPADAASLGTIHMDRTFGDDGWRADRQPWDWKDQPFPISHNEPIGPRSSVAEEVDPMRLAMLRAVGLINGVEAFVLHNGAGVFGAVDAARNRPANLWEVPGINEVMRAVRGVDAWLPQRVGDGQHWNNAWAGNPWVVDAFWSSGDNHGVNRNYTVSTPDGWVSTESGVKDFAVFTAARHSRVEVFDVLKGKVKEVELQAGQTLTLNPDSKDDHGYGAFIIVGHFL